MHCVFNFQLNFGFAAIGSLMCWTVSLLYFQGEGEGSVVAEIQSDGNSQQEGEGGGNAMANASE